MIKAYLGVDPGLSNIGLTLRSAGSVDIFDSVYVPINIPAAVKRGFVNNQARTNWKLKQIYNRVKIAIAELMETYNLEASDILAVIESYFYRPSKTGKSNNNAAYDTVAAVAIIKSLFFYYEIEFDEVMSTQMRRILTWKAYGLPDNKLDKDKVEDVVKDIVGTSLVDDILKDYAKGHHEHIVDSMAFSIVIEYKEAYKEYMKIPLKKRKLMAEALKT